MGKHLNRKTILTIGLLAIFLLAGWGKSQADDSPLTSLVQVELQSQADLEKIATLEISIYGPFWDDQGGEFLLLQVTPEVQDQLQLLGLPIRILDDDSNEAIYFEIYLPDAQIKAQLPEEITLLAETNQSIIVRATKNDAAYLMGLGATIRPLFEHPLVLPNASSQAQAISSSFTSNPIIRTMINQVDTDDGYDYVGGLSGAWSVLVGGNPYTFNTRNTFSGKPIEKATWFAYDQLDSLGFFMDYDYYNYCHSYYGCTEQRNVIAEQTGITNPGCVVLLVAHIDSYSTNTDPVYIAPGADDNASGTAGVIVAAEALHQYRFACTIRYILFTAEEYGYWGSKDYAAQMYAKGENIIGVVNMDMIGYNSDSNLAAEAHIRANNSGDLALANLFSNVITNYGIGLTPQIISPGLTWSDHQSFWNYGYSAVMLMEDYQDFTPYYHKSTDLLSTIDPGYHAKIIKTAVGMIAHLAGVIPPEEMYFPLIFK
jgi:hypothetical protein